MASVGHIHLNTISINTGLAPCPWETSLQSNDVSHWLGANLESALKYISKYDLNCNKNWCSRSYGHHQPCWDQSRYAPSQWETSLHCNGVSHWLGAYVGWSLPWLLSSRVNNYKAHVMTFHREVLQLVRKRQSSTGWQRVTKSNCINQSSRQCYIYS